MLTEFRKLPNPNEEDVLAQLAAPSAAAPRRCRHRESRRKNGRASGFTNESSRLRGRADWQEGARTNAQGVGTHENLGK